VNGAEIVDALAPWLATPTPSNSAEASNFLQ
jgi:hypothetical protein